MRNVVLVSLLAAALAACGRPFVVTQEPVFTAADARQPGLRPGVWANPSPDCDYDPGKPASSWPPCANGQIVRATEAAAIGEKFEPYVLAGGYPRVMQMRETGEAAEPDGPAPMRYLYEAVAVSRFDAQGRIVAARIWPVTCPRLKEGAVPPDPCISPDPATLQVAARDENEPTSWLWLRDGEQ